MLTRRHFLAATAAPLFAQPQPGWRTYELTTRIEVLKPSGRTRIWAPLAADTAYQQARSNHFQADAGSATLVEKPEDNLSFVSADFQEGARPVLTVTSRVATRDTAVDLSPATRPDRPANLSHFLRPTRLIPTDGIVKETAAEITRGAAAPLDRARAIYQWIVENTARNPKTRGCGLGDIRFMIESRDLTGKCADLNALYVGLARAAGLPARDVYGIRIAPSRLGYKSLGASSATVTKSQHCRAEVWLDDFGWVPADPADVRKVALEEPPGNRPLDDDMVLRARARLFGSWEGNWMAYNFAHDVALPGSTRAPIPFLMYPQAETAAGPTDSLDPDAFHYEITAQEVGAAAR
jgi:transglutaminase-like putative cysteine protease